MVAYDAYMENTKQLTETEAAVNYISMRMNEGDTSGHSLPSVNHTVTAAEYALAAKRAAGEERTI
jgi:hypothetical protein